MKRLTVFWCLVLVATARGYLIKVPTTPVLQPSIAPFGWVQIQKLILPLFENVCEESKNPLIVKLSQDFQLDTANGDYTSPDFVKNLVELKSSKGLLPKNKIFTEYKTDYLNELKVVYDVLYYAKDFSAFYKAACWARQNVNCGLFIDALYSAILNRKDTEKVLIPAPYEILPNYFVRKDFIIKASALIAGDEITLTNDIRNDGNSYIVDVNYTTQAYYDADESKLVYFYEDVGLNSYYYLTKLKIAPWINSNHKNNRYGEYLYSLIKQLMARYNLERYSNGLPEIESIDWDNLNTVPHYNPMLIYSDGNDFSSRKLGKIENNDKFKLLRNIENNIETVVTHMRERGFNKVDVLNHLMEILMMSDTGYENLALQILNNDTEYINRPPSVLEHYMTTLRDPAFWAVNKKMVDLVENGLKLLPGYTKDELYFPGVEVTNVEVKKMMTSFDNFVFDITDALKTGEDDTKFKVKICQSRLNHKPFSIKINVTSLVSQKGLLRIFLGPKILPGEHALKKNLFMLLDFTEINLKYGSNIITRTSSDMIANSDDLFSIYDIKKKISNAEFGLDSSANLKFTSEQIKFPSRLIIPKGLPEGLPLQLFVFVVPFGNVLGGRLINTQINKDILLSPGFPLDLNVEVQQIFDLPNALIKDILVTHKENDDQANYGGRPGVKSWQNNDYQSPTESVTLPLAARPDFTFRKEPYDYKSKKGQYGKKEDFSIKRDDYKYKKDYTKVIDKPIVSNDDKYISVVESVTKNSNNMPDDILNIRKDNVVYAITTDRTYNSGNTFTINKKIQDNGMDEEFHIDVMDNEKLEPHKTPGDFNEIFHKIIIRNDTSGTSDSIITDTSKEDFDETPWNKANERVIIDVTKDNRKLLDMASEDSSGETSYGIYDVKDTNDVSKTTPNNIFYDIVFYPFYDKKYGSEENVYE